MVVSTTYILDSLCIVFMGFYYHYLWTFQILLIFFFCWVALHVLLFKWRIIVLIWETFPCFLFDGVTHKRKENENFPYFLSDKAPGQEVLRRNCTVKPTYHIVGHFIHLPVSTTALSPMTQNNHKYRSKHSNFTFTDVCCAAHERSHLRQKKKKVSWQFTSGSCLDRKSAVIKYWSPV